MPTWGELKNNLIEKGIRLFQTIENGNKRIRKLEIAKKQADYWNSFTIIKDTIGRTEFNAIIKEIFESADDKEIPQYYKQLMKIRPQGIITTNIDGFANRALVAEEGPTVVEFSGKNCGGYLHILKNEKPFIINLHGKHTDVNTWVFTKKDLEELQKIEGYHKWIEACLLTKVIIFVGVNITDISVQSHLQKFTKDNLDTGAHYWITAERSNESLKFCNDHNILPVFYSEKDNHKELYELLKDLVNSESKEEIPLPISSDMKYKSKIEIGSDEFKLADVNTQRLILNSKATEILKIILKKHIKHMQNFEMKIVNIYIMHGILVQM